MGLRPQDPHAPPPPLSPGPLSTLLCNPSTPPPRVQLSTFPGGPGLLGEENGNPLQYSRLENPTDRRAWRATVHGIARVGHDSATKPPPALLPALTTAGLRHSGSCSHGPGSHPQPGVQHKGDTVIVAASWAWLGMARGEDGDPLTLTRQGRRPVQHVGHSRQGLTLVHTRGLTARGGLRTAWCAKTEGEPEWSARNPPHGPQPHGDTDITLDVPTPASGAPAGAWLARASCRTSVCHASHGSLEEART